MTVKVTSCSLPVMWRENVCDQRVLTVTPQRKRSALKHHHLPGSSLPVSCRQTDRQTHTHTHFHTHTLAFMCLLMKFSCRHLKFGGESVCPPSLCRLPYYQYFGGVSSMSKDQYLKINGFPNNYWGWGGEDDDIYNRS